MAKSLDALKASRATEGPQTDDELHSWIKQNLGFDIPRVAICEGHRAPFEFIADLYFERVTSAIALANRGGSKTLSSAILHFLNSIFKPGCESMTVGAIEAQAKRCYENLKKIIVQHGGKDVYEPKDHPAIVRSIESETTFKNGSMVEIVPGTMAAVSGPHPPKVHVDEQDQMDRSVWEQSRHMSQTKTILGKDGSERIIKAQDWITSTRQRPAGPMQRLIDEIHEAEQMGTKPPFELYTWCVYETAKNVPNCQKANPDLPLEQACNCHLIVKGKWEDGTPRRFSDVCAGKLARSQGFVELDNIHKRFQESDQDEWESQQECQKPELGGMLFKTWNRKRYGIKWFRPDPSNGFIYMSVDFTGGSVPSAVTWYQILNKDVLVHGLDDVQKHPTKALKAGTRVAFDEIYVAEIGNTQLADMVVQREKEWKEKLPDWKVKLRFYDPANKASLHDWNYHKPRLPLHFYCTRDIRQQIKTCNQVLREDLFAVDVIRCKMMPKEFDAYHYPDKKDGQVDEPDIPVKDFDHTMSNFRYFIENIKYLERKKTTSSMPVASDPRYVSKSPVKSSAPRYLTR